MARAEGAINVWTIRRKVAMGKQWDAEVLGELKGPMGAVLGRECIESKPNRGDASGGRDDAHGRGPPPKEYAGRTPHATRDGARGWD